MSTTVLQKKTGNIHLPLKQTKELGFKEGDELLCRSNVKTGELIVTKLK